MFPARGIGCSRIHASLAALLAACLAIVTSAQTPPANPPLHAAALRNDAAAVESLLAAGADPNALNAAGATALHYGTGSERIVKALLARGATVDAVSKADLTPLCAAVARPDSFAVVQRLVSAGADVNFGRSSNRRRDPSPLSLAVTGGDRRTIELLLARGADVNPASGYSPLNIAAFMGDLETVRRLLDRGAKINGDSVFAGPALNTAFYAGHTEIVKLLIERGADLTVRSPSGHGTPPMVWSAYNDTGDTTIAKLLLARGLDVNTANDQGETALSWALKRGTDTPLVAFLREKGAKPPAVIRPKTTPAKSIPADATAREAFVRDRVQRSLDALQRGSIVFLDNAFVRTAKCISCHQQTLPGTAFGLARERGLHVDDRAFGQQLHAQLAMIEPRAEHARQMAEPVPDAAVSIGYNFDALDAIHYTRDETTDAITGYLINIQRAEGNWPSYDRRPPMEDGVIIATAWAARAVQLYPAAGRERDVTASLSRARRWLAQQTPHNQNERIFQLLGLAWTGETAATMASLAKALTAEQKRDGGWSQLPGLDSDSWATGSALIALHKAGVAVRDPAYQRGVEFLLRTQFDDGSWWVRSRTWPFQPHFDGQFPHGKDQWISAGGTAWAAMALLLTLEPTVAAASLPTGQQLVAKFLGSADSNKTTAATASAKPVTGGVEFARDIKPLLERSCAGCHIGEKVRGGFSLASREDLLKGGQSREPAIVPGRSTESHLVRYIADQVEDLEMPPLDRREKYPALTAAEISRVRAWIDGGANWEK